MIVVLDASIAVKWFFHDEPNVILARHVLSSIEVSTEQFLVPDLFFIEVNAVLVRKSEYDFHFVEKAMGLLLRLGIRTVPSLGDILPTLEFAEGKLKCGIAVCEVATSDEL